MGIVGYPCNKRKRRTYQTLSRGGWGGLENACCYCSSLSSSSLTTLSYFSNSFSFAFPCLENWICLLNFTEANVYCIKFLCIIHGYLTLFLLLLSCSTLFSVVYYLCFCVFYKNNATPSQKLPVKTGSAK